MKIDEGKTIENNMIDGYFIRNRGKPKESEIKACLKFFEEIKIMMETKDAAATVDTREKALVGIWFAVIDRNVLISNFNLDTNEPSFIKNTIQIQ